MDSRPPHDKLSDTELVAGFLDGDDRAFDALYHRYRLPLYSYINRLLCGRRDQADDVFQQTWVKAVRNLPRYTDRMRFLAWLCRIAHNLVMDFYRSGDNAMQELPEHLEAHSCQPLEQLNRELLESALQEALERLPAEQREIVRLRNEGVSFKEIASRQGIGLNTALGRMHYAVQNLRRMLRDFF